MSTPTGIKVAPEIVPLIPDNADKWRLLILAERFQPQHRDAFFAFSRFFTEFLRTQAPFSDDDIAKAIQVYACFTPSPPKGLFETKEKSIRRIFGEPDRVRKYLKKHMAKHPVLKRRTNDLVLVLINLAQRGGAGEQQDDNIAWTTPVPFFDDRREMLEDWPQVALHELGHAFNLDDEYESAGVDRKNAPVCANICRDAEIGAPPWSAMLDDPVKPLRSADRALAAGHNPDYPTDDELARFGKTRVGKFQGALYSNTKFWRSALQCRMRSTRDPFCAVCQAVIRKAIVSNR
jgi:hypothetical protein